MFKRKRKSSEYDDDFLSPLNMEQYGEEPQDDSIRRRKRGCISALALGALVLVCGFIGYRVYQSSGDLFPTPASTTSPDDGPIAVEEGLVFAEYAVDGQQTGVYDLDGKEIASPGGLPLYAPVSAAENPLAGLDAIAYPEGAFYDAASGQLVVFGPPAQGESTSRDDFLAALRAVYNGDDPGVSIDPVGSETVQDVRYIGQTENTHLGWVMFEADRRMKTLSMGQDNITGEPVTSSVPGFADMFDLELQLGDQNQNEVRRRFWFKVPIAEIEQTPDGMGMWITTLSLSVDTEYLDADWQTSTSQPPDPAGRAFAAHLTDHYDEYASEFVVFDDLKAAARWTVLAHWLQQADLPLQPELWLQDSPSPYGDAPLTTPAITATRQNQQANVIQTLMLWGGVDLGMRPVIKPASEATLGRMENLVNTFKSWTGSARLEFAGEGFSPIATSQIRQDAVSALELPLPGAPSLMRNLDGWALSVPHLTREGSDQNAIFIFENPSESRRIVLTHDGRDPETNTEVFVNKEQGLRLDIYADGYQVLTGRFQGEQFSYLENDRMFFDLQGNILEDVKTGTRYEYGNGALTRIRQGAADIEIKWDGGNKIRHLKSADGEISFTYDNDLLTEIRGADGETIRTFVYDEGRLVSETGLNGGAVETIRYDAEGRILFRVVDNNPILYDWNKDGALTQISGKALVPWQEADMTDLEDLKAMLHLRRDGVIGQTLFVRQVGETLVVTANDKSYTLPAALLQNPGALRSRLASVLGQPQAPGEMILISTGGVQEVAFQSLFKDSILLTAETMDEARIIENIEILRRKPQGFTPDDASVINAVPLPAEAEAAGSSPGLWYVEPGDESSKTWKSFFDEVIALPDVSIPVRPAVPAEVGKALSEDLSVLIVVAHSDGQNIYLPNGLKFNPAALSPEEMAQIALKKPLVILLSCDTAAPPGGGASFAQKLLETGPRVVIAPNGKINVAHAYMIFETFLKDSLSKTDALQSFFNAVKETYPDFLIPGGDGKDHTFKFQVRIIQPISQESAT